MRATLLVLAAAPTCAGRRVLDAGCGTGALAVEAARRGAEVVAIDLSPTLVDLARERSRRDLGAGAHRLPRRRHARPRARPLRPRRGDGLADPLRAADDASARGRGLAARTDALDALHLRAAHPGARRRCTPSAGCSRAATARRRSSRCAETRCAGCIARTPGLRRLAAGRTERVASGFYTSQALELRRAHERGVNATLARGLERGSARASCRSPMPRPPSCRSAGCCGCRCSRSRSAWRWCCSSARSTA